MCLGSGRANPILTNFKQSHFIHKKLNKMTKYNKAVVKVSDIKTGFYRPENSEGFLKMLGMLLKTIFPLEAVVVHKETMQLIANGHYLELAISQGKDEIEVVLADFPEEDLIHAVATHWKPTKKFAVMFNFIAIFMKYYSLKKGPGAKYREGLSDLTLRELVAEILGTNKTYLDMIEAIGKFKFELLKSVDAGDVSLQEAFAMVPKKEREKKDGKKDGDGKGNKQNYIIPITSTDKLSFEELHTLTNNLPARYAEQIGNSIMPNDLSIAKAYTYNDVFQGFSIVYSDSAKSIVTHISYTDALRESLLNAA
jgi:hypothetical protein